MSHWAKDHALFEDGHYVEDWELVRFEKLSDAVRKLLAFEALHGNKIRAIGERYVCLSRPPSSTLDDLPPALAFVCPVRFGGGVFCYDGDELGRLIDVSTEDVIDPPWQL